MSETKVIKILRVAKNTHHDLKILAAVHEITMSDMLEILITEHKEKNNEKPR